MALISTSVGRLIDRIGGRVVMSAGSVVVALALYLLSFVHAQWAYLAVWALMGVGMRLCLYDAAFAAIVQVTPTRGRMAISYLTLFGAFASSVFWVVGHYLDEAFGWRQTLVIFAALNILVCLPLHWFGLARREQASAVAEKASPAAGSAPAAPPLEGQARTIGIALVALIMSLNGFVFGVVSVQLVPLLEGAGLAAVTAVWLASLKGVAQFAGRVVEITLGRNLSPITVARLSMAAMVIAFALLYCGGGVFGFLAGFTFLMGAAQGVLSIVRGTVPLALFGAKGYGAVTGLIATPILFVSACAPTIFAWITDRWGWSSANLVVLGTAAVSFLCMEAMALWHRRHLARLAAGEPVQGAASG
jgi:MFS family permease